MEHGVFKGAVKGDFITPQFRKGAVLLAQTTSIHLEEDSGLSTVHMFLIR